MPSDSATVAAYQLAHADHRAEITLGWNRACLFLVLNAALCVSGAAIASASARAALPLFLLGLVLSAIGALIVRRSHARTRRTRDALEAAAQRAGVEGPEVTGGQRVLHGKPRAERYKVTTLVVAGLVAIGVADALAILLLAAPLE